MKFSILIPVYNVEKFIEKSIESVINQTYKDFELILVDDGSQDNSLMLCEQKAEVDERIKVISKKNEGVTATRKYAASLSTGDYIVWVDGDDYICEELLEKLNDTLEKFPNADIIGIGHYMDNNGEISKPIFHKLQYNRYYETKELRNRYMLDTELSSDNIGVMTYSLWSKCVRREICAESIQRIPNYIKNGEDALCTAWMLSKAEYFVNIDFAGYYYRYNTNSLTHKRSKIDFQNVANVTREIEKIKKYNFKNIAHYYLSSLYVLLRDVARKATNYSEYIELAKEIVFLKEYSFVNFSFKFGILCFLKYKLIQRQKWKILYWLIKGARL